MRDIKTTSRNRLRIGFTIVEIIIVIAIIGVLSTIVLVSYKTWQNSIIVATLKSDLNSVSSAMENVRTFGNAYPLDVASLTTFSASEGVTLSGGSADDGETYCIDAISSEDTSLHYYIDSLTGTTGAQQGTCASAHPIPANLVATVTSDFSIDVSWDAVSGATSYTLQRDTSTSFASPTIVTQAGTMVTSGGLSQGTTYYYRVRAITAGMSGGWSTIANASTTNTAIVAPINLVAAVDSSTGINVSWGAVSGATSYTIHRDISPSFESPNSTTQAGITLLSSGLSQGIKYYYRVKATGANGTSGWSTTADATTTINAPVAPTVTAVTVITSTTWSWNSASCPAGTTARYQYRYTITPSGYDSGWIAIAGSPVAFTTSTVGQKYTVQIQAQCYTADTASVWSVTGQASKVLVIVLVVAGGGAGGNEENAWTGGGGGAGGLIYNASYSIDSGANGVTVGLGGNTSPTTSGQNSVFGTLIAIGGGRGAAWNLVNLVGGSGGGGSSQYNWPSAAGTPGQGYPGGSGYGAEYHMCAGGGGGAGGTGYDAGGRPPAGKPGGPGLDYSSVFGTSVGVNGWFAGGGGGGANGDAGMGMGGAGGGGNGAIEGTAPGSPGLANTGGGGGGGGGQYWVQNAVLGGPGGSGIVLIAYPTGSMTATGGTTYTFGSNTIHKFTSSGTFTAP